MLLEVKKLANGYLVGTQGELPMFVANVKEMSEVITNVCNNDVEMKDYLIVPGKKKRVRHIKRSRAKMNKRWTEEDDKKLKELVLSGANYGRIALELSRSNSAVRVRAYNLGLLEENYVK